MARNRNALLNRGFLKGNIFNVVLSTWMPQMPWQKIMFLLFILSFLTSVDASGIRKRQSSDDDHNHADGDVHDHAEDDVTFPIVNSSTSKNITAFEADDNKDKDNTGAVVAASVIAVVALIALVLAVYIFKRRRQSRMMDKEKKMQIQMSSARNAGVYQDLTVSVPTEDQPPASPEHERLKATEDA